ncbi:serine/threonine protein kinase [Streptomyces durmitorensis]|uniref:Serine/threonine protein kinase n=1 Tax=Streptomyces durmitorensis TaxID=319947 RepID=A0ABY4PPY2_9ACTN|nr:serine/threonine-protein kinase [Streptomyces durmitorensis]UQT55068.1 serine/threonine protein kinase [Streptomyces durmitorensis]
MNDATEVFQPLQADDPPVVAGYRLAARIGAGGMGRVYLSHTQGGRPLAIKVVRPELADDPAFRRRFSREIKAAQRVRGAYTAELIDADADGVPPWLATLYVPGPSLSDAVARSGPLPVPAVLWLMAGVAEALQAIHGAGIVHRDLKPSNVLLAADGPRVIDFGISLASGATSPHTATGSVVGTPQFMAPEQASVGEVTAATDVFALGQTAAFAALGEPLYGDGPSVSVLYRIVHSEPDLSLLPAQLRPLFARCLAADPAERATLAEIVDWCRQRLGPGADAGAGPAVWREVTGPEVSVPAPVPHPTRMHTQPLFAPPRPTVPTGQDERRARRRRNALITGIVTGSALLVLGLTWMVMDATDLLRHRDTSAKSGSSASERSSGSGAASGSAAGGSSGDGERAATGEDSGTGDKSDGAAGASRPSSGSSSTANTPPQAVAYPQEWFDEKNSVSLREPVDRKDRKGDIRFVCGENSCALESDKSVITLLYSKPGATLDSCRTALTGADSHDLPLAAVAAGSEICVRNPAGDIALLVVQVKSTALPNGGFSFLSADMTVWRDRAS